jgi:uncharacterized protein
MSHSRSKGTAVITGASRGIGAVYADRLARRGYDLILVARNEARLEALSARLTRGTGRSVTLLPADLNARADLARVETTLRDNQSLTMLLNNAECRHGGVGEARERGDVETDDVVHPVGVGIESPLCHNIGGPERTTQLPGR